MKIFNLIFALIKSKGKYYSYDFEMYYETNLIYYFKTKYFSDLEKRPIEEIYQIGFELGCRPYYPNLLLAKSFQYSNYYGFIHGFLEYKCGLSQKKLKELSEYYEKHKLPKDIKIENENDFVGNGLKEESPEIKDGKILKPKKNIIH